MLLIMIPALLEVTLDSLALLGRDFAAILGWAGAWEAIWLALVRLSFFWAKKRLAYFWMTMAARTLWSSLGRKSRLEWISGPHV